MQPLKITPYHVVLRTADNVLSSILDLNHGLRFQIKEIAFRKPFSKRLKEHILTTIFVDMPPNSHQGTSHVKTEDLEDLRALFESDNESAEFHGFEVHEYATLENIFFGESFDEDFLGFS